MDKDLQRLRKNLKQKIHYYNERGNYIDPSFLNELTKEELESITTEDLLTTIQEQQWNERFELYDVFPDESDMIIQNFRESYQNYNDTAVSLIENWLETLRESRGDWAVAVMLQGARNNGYEISNREIYGDLKGFLTDFLDYLPEGYGFDNATKSALMESIEIQWDDNSYWGF